MSVSATKMQMNTSGEQNDINDPVVQDVLNEFRDELQSSKHKENAINSQNVHHQHIMPPPQNTPLPSNNPSYYSHPPIHNIPDNVLHQQSNTFNSSYSQHLQSQNKNDYMTYIDIELIKKNLIIVLIVFLIYHSGIINNLYEKIPDYLQDNITTFDIYIKSTIIFIILYTISYMKYV